MKGNSKDKEKKKKNTKKSLFRRKNDGHTKGKKKNNEKINEGKREMVQARFRKGKIEKSYPRFFLFVFLQWNLLTKKNVKWNGG